MWRVVHDEARGVVENLHFDRPRPAQNGATDVEKTIVPRERSGDHERAVGDTCAIAGETLGIADIHVQHQRTPMLQRSTKPGMPAERYRHRLLRWGDAENLGQPRGGEAQQVRHGGGERPFRRGLWPIRVPSNAQSEEPAKISHGRSYDVP